MNYTPAALQWFPWNVSTATLRPDHLAAAYLPAVDYIETASGDTFPASYRSDLETLASYATSTTSDHIITPAQIAAVEAVWDWLEQHAPEGFYFGSADGDAAEVGFWLVPDWQEALADLNIATTDPAATAELIQHLDAIGATPATLSERIAGTATGTNDTAAGADFAQGFAEDAGLVPDFTTWPMTCIDWRDAWEELRHDGYTITEHGSGWLVFMP